MLCLLHIPIGWNDCRQLVTQRCLLSHWLEPHSLLIMMQATALQGTRPKPALAHNAAAKARSISNHPAFRSLLHPREQRVSQIARGASIDPATDNRFPRWEFMWRDLNNKGLVTLRPEDALELVQSGNAVLVDVRPKDAYEKSHPDGAINVPIFQVLELTNLPNFGKLLKIAAMAANGVQATDYNPDFVALVKAAAAEGKAVILACEAGGTMESSTNFATGKTSRSLKGCWKLVASGAVPADKCLHLDGGVYRWAQSGLPMVGDYDPSNAGRTPNAVDSN